jgi:hypothetical protein
MPEQLLAAAGGRKAGGELRPFVGRGALRPGIHPAVRRKPLQPRLLPPMSGNGFTAHVAALEAPGQLLQHGSVSARRQENSDLIRREVFVACFHRILK